MIRLEKITFSVEEKRILNNISFSLEKGEKVVFTGPSGSGKSTILRLLIGAVIQSSGDYFFSNEPVNHLNIHDIRNKLAFVGQEPVLAADYVEDALLLPFSYKAHKNNPPEQHTIIDLLENFNLDSSILKQRVDKVSGGEKQRLALARAILLNKKIFLLDEITSALDPDSKEKVINQLIKPEYTVISVSHDKDWIEKSSSVLYIEKGELR